MSDLVRRQTEMAVRVSDFATANTDLYRTNQIANEAFGVIRNNIKILEDGGALRESAAESKLAFSERRKSYRAQLYSALTEIARTARQIARDNDAFVNNFKAPRDNRNDRLLLDTANAFITDLWAVKDLFVAYAEDPLFIDDLIEDKQALENSINEQGRSERQRIGAGASLDDALDHIMTAVGKLKIIMPKLLKDHPDKLAAWLSASHVQRAPRKKPTPKS